MPQVVMPEQWPHLLHAWEPLRMHVPRFTGYQASCSPNEPRSMQGTTKVRKGGGQCSRLFFS